jgi:prepilin-type N-terminal cleavage/methylation domain-containing protein/prepilin-type processing-associated H-X9-DG protein
MDKQRGFTPLEINIPVRENGRFLTGFTLIELLVVIAIIALLMAILLSALQRARKQAAGSACLANVKSISTAWFMYHLNNNDFLVYSWVLSGQKTSWVQMPQDEAGNTTWSYSNPYCPLEDKIRGIERGLIFPYMGKTHKAFHCSADHRQNFGIEGYRSYSMIGCLNGRLKDSSLYKYQIRKYTQIKSPGDKYMLVEEADSRGFNTGWWTLATREMGYDPVQWNSPLAVWHGDSSTLGFCDGHAELHRWREKLTIELGRKTVPAGGAMYGMTTVPEGHRTDIDYMDRGWAYKFTK